MNIEVIYDKESKSAKASFDGYTFYAFLNEWKTVESTMRKAKQGLEYYLQYLDPNEEKVTEN